MGEHLYRVKDINNDNSSYFSFFLNVGIFVVLSPDKYNLTIFIIIW